MDFKIVIPARYHSNRLPGKPLANIEGKPMIWHTYQRALETGVAPEHIFVATDHLDVFAAVEAFGAQAIMTDSEHPSGTSRLKEVADKMQWPDDTLIMNIQGDEPFVQAAEINAVMAALAHNPNTAIATLACPLSPLQVQDPNVVKVVLDAKHQALYFSRSAIPFVRADQQAAISTPAIFYRHIGLYAYRCKALKAYHEHPPCPMEQFEQLEQLRALYYGMPVHVVTTQAFAAFGVDTPEDLEKARNYAKNKAFA